ncbi:MAG TPA: hypothetical protein VFT43_03290, partial [Candidatus Polarisedimenticolia bacterium]|nr:hypothetical protein [Candidatus Polarisedimenticolia bacterium]
MVPRVPVRPQTVAAGICLPGEGGLDARGHLKIQVRGLVFADEPSVPPELRGKNDEDAFRGA